MADRCQVDENLRIEKRFDVFIIQTPLNGNVVDGVVGQTDVFSRQTTKMGREIVAVTDKQR